MTKALSVELYLERDGGDVGPEAYVTFRAGTDFYEFPREHYDALGQPEHLYLRLGTNRSGDRDNLTEQVWPRPVPA